MHAVIVSLPPPLGGCVMRPGSAVAGTFLSPSGAKLQHRTGLACRWFGQHIVPSDASPLGLEGQSMRKAKGIDP